MLGIELTQIAIDSANARLQLIMNSDSSNSTNDNNASNTINNEKNISQSKEYQKFQEITKTNKNMEFEKISFFDIPTQEESLLFDFVYDYTFLCAFHPSVHIQWAKKMGELIRKGGYVCFCLSVDVCVCV